MEFQILQGGGFNDDRGEIRFVNDFDMTEVKRFYTIKNSDLHATRGWRAHRIEKRWFFVISGSFNLGVVKIDDWISPSRDLRIDKIELSAKDVKLLYVPSGYGTALTSLDPKSEILVFSDHVLAHAEFDDYTYDLTHFTDFGIME